METTRLGACPSSETTVISLRLLHAQPPFMKHISLPLLSGLLLSCLLVSCLRADEFTPDPGFMSLFNGKDLTGWGFRAKVDKTAVKPGDVVASFDGKTESNDNGRYSAKDGILTVNFPKGVERLVSQ